LRYWPTPEEAWIPALDQDGTVRPNGQVVELTERVKLGSWPQNSRVIVRRERPHASAQLSCTDHDGYRFQAILTDQPDGDIAVLERRHRQRARVEDASATTRTPAWQNSRSRRSP
jgi:hypothetical protein